MVLQLVKETLLWWHGSFVGKKQKKFWRVIMSCVFWTLGKERSQRSFESKEMLDQALKLVFLCTLLLWVRMYIDGGSLTMFDFIN